MPNKILSLALFLFLPGCCLKYITQCQAMDFCERKAEASEICEERGSTLTSLIYNSYVCTDNFEGYLE